MLKGLPTLVAIGLILAAEGAVAQRSDAQEDGHSARIDAMFGTHDRYTPVPRNNIFATTPGLEQQARRSTFTFNGLLPFFYNSNADLTPRRARIPPNSTLFLMTCPIIRDSAD